MHDQARRGYGTAGAAAAYERGRPGYPEDAVAELVGVLGVVPGATVLDLAAGTGKLTRQLMATGATLVAVEPVAAMRDRLARLAAGKVLGGAEPANPADGPGGGLSVLGGRRRRSRCGTGRWTRSRSGRRSTGSTPAGPSPSSAGCCGRAGAWA